MWTRADPGEIAIEWQTGADEGLLFGFVFFLLTSLALSVSGRLHFRRGGIDVDAGGSGGKRKSMVRWRT